MPEQKQAGKAWIHIKFKIAGFLRGTEDLCNKGKGGTWHDGSTNFMILNCFIKTQVG
jgi:hypothetical protein